MRRAAAALLVVASVAGVASAADPPTSPKRRLPDYDGVPAPGPSAGEVVAWVPRVVLSPAWLVWELGLRRPLNWLVVTAERGDWPSEILSFFTFGGRKDLGLVPTFYVDLGFRPTAGLYFFWDEALHPRHGIRLRASIWTDGFSFSLADRWRIDAAGSRLQLRAEATRRPDLTFYGVGARTSEDDEARFGLDRLATELSFDWKLGYGEHVRAAVALRDQRFRESSCCSGRRLEELPDPPDGFPDGYLAFISHLDGTFDTRAAWPGRQTGLRVDAHVEHGAALDGSASWLNVGGTVGLFWDVVGMGRVLGVTATVAMVEPQEGEVPFLELVDLGGGPTMVGFRRSRLVGRSGAAASLRYDWPIWAALAGSLQVDLGNVFGPHLEDFDASLLRVSTAFGFRSMGPSDHELQVVIGLGTETFEDGLGVATVRLAIGGTYGF